MIDLLAGWRAGAIVVSHDRELLETMDAIVELTSLGATRYGGNWSHYRERKALELAAARHDLADAEKRVAEVAAQRAGDGRAEGAQGRRGQEARRAKGDMPRIHARRLKDRSEETGGENARLAERRRAQALEDAAAARERIEILQPLSVVLPPTGLPAEQDGADDRRRHRRLRAGPADHPRPVLHHHRPGAHRHHRAERFGQDDVARAHHRAAAALGGTRRG